MAFNQYKPWINDAYKLISSPIGVSQFNTYIGYNDKFTTCWFY